MGRRGRPEGTWQSGALARRTRRTQGSGQSRCVGPVFQTGLYSNPEPSADPRARSVSQEWSSSESRAEGLRHGSGAASQGWACAQRRARVLWLPGGKADAEISPRADDPPASPVHSVASTQRPAVAWVQLEGAEEVKVKAAHHGDGERPQLQTARGPAGEQSRDPEGADARSAPVLHSWKTATSSFCRQNKCFVFTLYIQSNTGGFVVVHLGPDERIFIFCCGTRGSFNGNLGQQNFPFNGATGIPIIGLCGA